MNDSDQSTMNIAMFTNTYKPMVGGAEKSIEVFTEDLRAAGHRTLVICPAFEGCETSTEHVLYLPSIKRVASTRYSLYLPFTSELRQRLEQFDPDVLHAHQPFHLGDTALRYGRTSSLPVVFTHHTMYERYVDDQSGEYESLKRLAIHLPTLYANLCDAVVAPTPSIKSLIQERGVETPVHVIPTGIDTDRFANGSRQRAQERWNLDDQAITAGHVGRLIPAKNLEYLAEAVAKWLEQTGGDGRFLLVGDGETRDDMADIIENHGVSDRVVIAGELKGDDLLDAYAAMDLFVFSSRTDTQGLVLVESMSAGTPVVALDATGARDVVKDGQSGRLLDADSTPDDFAKVMTELSQDRKQLQAMGQQANQRAVEYYDRAVCCDQLAELYRNLIEQQQNEKDLESWEQLTERLGVEWDLFSEKLMAAGRSLFPRSSHR